jgi:hypothetical protein
MVVLMVAENLTLHGWVACIGKLLSPSFHKDLAFEKLLTYSDPDCIIELVRTLKRKKLKEEEIGRVGERGGRKEG